MVDVAGNPDWERDCNHWWGRLLTGDYAHWCDDWDDLPIDETCSAEFSCCNCFPISDHKFMRLQERAQELVDSSVALQGLSEDRQQRSPFRRRKDVSSKVRDMLV